MTTLHHDAADGILTLTIDLPGQSMNVINADFTADLAAAIDTIKADAAIKGVVITSGKASGFMAGADLKGMGALFGTVGSIKATFDEVYWLNSLFRSLETCGKPVAAAINGLALGGGLELALACHYRVCSDNPKIALGLPEILVGLFPGAGGTQRLPRLMGVQPALMYLTQGKSMSPQEALGFKVVNELAPASEVVARAKAWVLANPKAVAPWDEKGFKFPGGVGAFNPGFAQTFVAGNAMTAKATNHNMNAPIALLSAVYEGSQLPIDTALRVESKYFARVVSDPQAGNMVRSLFVSKQAAEKGARRPKNVAPMPPKKIAMLGAGLMGAGVAMVAAQAGVEVVLLDRDRAAAGEGQGLHRRAAGEEADRPGEDGTGPRPHPPDRRLCRPCRLRPDHRGGVRGPGDQGRGDQARRGGRRRRHDLRVEHLDAADHRPRRGMVEARELHRHPLLLARRENAARRDHRRQGDRAPSDSESPGFRRGDPQDADRRQRQPRLLHLALLRNVHPGGTGAAQRRRRTGVAGECRQADGDAGRPARGQRRGRARPVVQDRQADQGRPRRRLSAIGERGRHRDDDELGRFGRKGGKGFYVYPDDGGKKYLWPELSVTVADLGEPSDATPEAIRERLLYRQLVECARCFAEGVLETPEDGDLGAIFGWGFLPFTGGPFSHMDTIGLAGVVAILDGLTHRHGERFTPPQLLRDMAAAGDTFYGRAAAKLAA